jgi:branched-chain amino acid transport system substrate-binding protein
MSVKKGIRAVLVIMLALLTLITGCGSPAEQPTAAGGTSTAAPATEPSAAAGAGYDKPINVPQGIDHDKKEIYIGTTYGTSGNFAYIGVPVVEAIRATINRINDEGGINGYKVVLKYYDGQNNAGEDQALLERLVEEDKVYMMTFLTGNQVNTSMNYLVDYGIPVFYVSSGLKEAFNAGPNIFPMQPAFLRDGRALAARILHESVFGPNHDQKLPADAKIGIIALNAAVGRQNLEGIEEQMRLEGRWENCVVEGVEGTAAGQVEAAVQKLKDAGVSVVVSLGTGVSAAYAACDDIGLDVPFFSTYANSGAASWPAQFYKESRPIYTTGWADYTTEKAAIGLDLYYRTMEYSTMSAAEIEALKEDFYGRAGFCAGLMIEQGLKRMAANGPDWSWESLIKAMEQEPVEMVTKEAADYGDGVRWGMTMEGLGRYFPNPEDPTKMTSELYAPFESVEDIMKK